MSKLKLTLADLPQYVRSDAYYRETFNKLCKNEPYILPFSPKSVWQAMLDFKYEHTPSEYPAICILNELSSVKVAAQYYKHYDLPPAERKKLLKETTAKLNAVFKELKTNGLDANMAVYSDPLGNMPAEYFWNLDPNLMPHWQEVIAPLPMSQIVQRFVEQALVSNLENNRTVAKNAEQQHIVRFVRNLHLMTSTRLKGKQGYPYIISMVKGYYGYEVTSQQVYGWVKKT